MEDMKIILQELKHICNDNNKINYIIHVSE